MNECECLNYECQPVESLGLYKAGSASYIKFSAVYAVCHWHTFMMTDHICMVRIHWVSAVVMSRPPHVSVITMLLKTYYSFSDLHAYTLW